MAFYHIHLMEWNDTSEFFVNGILFVNQIWFEKLMFWLSKICQETYLHIAAMVSINVTQEELCTFT